MADDSGSFTIRQFSVPVRLVLSAFLISVGLGYFSALVQLHFAGGAKAGEPLPDKEAVERTYASGKGGGQPMSQLERLLENKEGAFTGAGTMRPAFTDKSDTKWNAKLAEIKAEGGDAAIKKLMDEREGERQAMLLWARLGAAGKNTEFKKAYKQDKFPLPDEMKDVAITDNFVIKDEDATKPRVVKIKSLFEERCGSCHAEDGRSNDARLYPFDDVEKLKPYLVVKAASSGLSLNKLAQTTHVHLLGFSMLYGLTGVIFAFTSYPALVRVVFAPLALVAQMADISCWWLARLDPMYAGVIQITGGFVAIGLAVQIIGSLFDMYNLKGKLILFVLLVIGLAGGGAVHQKIVGPYLEQEKAAAAAAQ